MSIKWFVMDVDGVLTDGKIVYTSTGEEIKGFFAQDGLGLAAAKKVGIKLAIITGRFSPMVEKRVKELKIDNLIMGCHNKSEALQQLIKKDRLELSEIAYIGDDLNDLGVLNLVGLPLAPANACEEVKKIAKYITQQTGGNGAIREAVEYILKEENLWDKVVKLYAQEQYTVGQ